MDEQTIDDNNVHDFTIHCFSAFKKIGTLKAQGHFTHEPRAMTMKL